MTSSSALTAPPADGPAPPAAQVCLCLYQKNHLAAEWRFDRSFCIGRDAGCDLRLDDPRVDVQHAEVFTDGTTWR